MIGEREGLAITGFEVEGAMSQEQVQPLETRKGKKMEEHSAASTLTVA
jgi:hypothetical protein